MGGKPPQIYNYRVENHVLCAVPINYISLCFHLAKCPPLSDVNIGLITVSSVLGLLFLFLCTCSGYFVWVCYYYGDNGQRDVIQAATISMVRRGCCCNKKTARLVVQRRNGPTASSLGETVGVVESQKGFSDKTAMKYAQGVAVSAQFGLEDDLVRFHIKSYMDDHQEVLQQWRSVVVADSAGQGQESAFREENLQHGGT